MIKLKSGPNGVQLRAFTAQCVLAITIAHSVWQEMPGIIGPFVVTSISEGQHSNGSLHYVGHAFDLRSPAPAFAQRLVAALKDALGDEYDVALETDHIHIEWQPKEQAR